MGRFLVLATLLTACGGTETVPPKSTKVHFDCEIAKVIDGTPQVVSRPKVTTLTGRPITITMNDSDAEGRPATDLKAELTPISVEQGLAVRGNLQLLHPVAQSHAIDVTGATPKVEIHMPDAGLSLTCQTSLPDA